MSVRRPLRSVMLLVAAAAACKARQPPLSHADASASSPVSVLLPAARPPSRVDALLVAEHARAIGEVHDDDLSSGEVGIRRAAARVLARSEDPRARDRLETLLADGDPEVLSFAAFGLAQVCAIDRDAITQRVALRGASERVEPQAALDTLDPEWALARALGRCAHPSGERTLVAWLTGPRDRARASALALGEIASRHRRLEEETTAALLRAAAGDAAQQALPEAFFPFGQLKQAPPRARELLMERLRDRLAVASPARVLAVRAMASMGAAAVADLRRVLVTTQGYTTEERAEAARSLGKMGSDEAREALAAAIDDLGAKVDPADRSSLVGGDFPVLWTAVETLAGLGTRAGAPSKGLQTLAVLPAAGEAPTMVQRRLTLLRCAAARALAGTDPEARVLTACDPDPSGVVGALARVAVLGRGQLRGARLVAWKKLAQSGPARVREEAIDLIGAHAEIDDVRGVLASALRSSEPGVVAKAAEQIGAHPDRVMVAGKAGPSRAKAPSADDHVDPEVAKALQEAIGRTFPDDAVETREQLARAAGAVRLDAARPWLTALCRSPIGTLRASAQTALSSLDRTPASCPASGAVADPPPKELAQLMHGKVELTLATDVGDLKMTLDASLAPVAVTRIVALARRGFYDGMPVHRVVPGFVVQFGDPAGDGYGGDGAPAMRCELSPVAFEGGAVGIATSGRDTGSSQVFVTLAMAPHLEGEYTWLGRAEGPWNVIVPGDVIKKVTVAALP
jgi:cyclophilin family peptidyl-prolyl cis-trans isomerase